MNFSYWKQSLDNNSPDTILNYNHELKSFINIEESNLRSKVIFKMTDDFYVIKETPKYVIKKHVKNSPNILIKFHLDEYDSFKRQSVAILMIEDYESKYFSHLFDTFLKTEDFLSKTSLTLDDIPHFLLNLVEVEKTNTPKKNTSIFLISIISFIILVLITYLVIN